MEDTSPPAVSVVVPVYNDAERLELCLEALSKQVFDLDAVEVLVVDNGSDEPPDELVGRYRFCRLLHESKPGSYAARNRALAEARGEILAFTDADCQPLPVWLSEALARLEEADGKAVIGGGIEVFAVDEAQPTAAELYDIAFGLRQDLYVQSYHYAATANMVTSRTVLDSVGEFNDDLKSSGDVEWGNRAHAAGWPILYAPEASVRHPARRSLSEIMVKARRHAGGRIDHLRTRSDRPSVGRQLGNVLRTVLPQVSHTRKGCARLAERGYGLWDRLRFSGVSFLLQYTRLAEMIRTRLGGRSVRR